MNEIEFAIKIKDTGGTAYIVGGAVRDLVIGKVPHDKDYVVTGVLEKDFFSEFPNATKVGNSFPVYLVDIDGEFCEVAFARTEKKNGHGYHGFVVSFNPSVTIEEDLFRRDTTMNAMAIEILTGKLVDPFNGKADIENHTINAVSHHFLDDPVRSLRAARQAAEHGFIISDATIEMMKLSKEELKTVTPERCFKELEKALNSAHPDVFFKYLKETDLISVCFPFISDVDASIKILKKVSTNNIIVKFAAMMSIYKEDVITALPCCYPSKMVKAAIVCSEFCDKIPFMTNIEVVEFYDVMKRYSGYFGMIELKVVLDSKNIQIPYYIDSQLYAKVIRHKVAIPKELKKEEIHDYVLKEKAKLLN